MAGQFTNTGGGSGSVGMAQGRFDIDTGSLARQRAAVIKEARLMGAALKSELGGKAEAGVRQAENALQRLSKSINTVSSGFKAALVLATTFGTASAQKLKLLEARFRLLAGSEEAAKKQLEELRDLADDSNQPFLDVVEGATALMPALRGTNADLGRTLNLVQRLAVLDPAQGVSGAAFAVREFLNGEYLSLVRRLELDRTKLQKIRDQAAGDQQVAINLLSEYVAELGLGEDALNQFGQEGVYTFQIMRDEATQLFGETFAPFLNDVLIPMTQQFSSLLRVLRETSPEMKRFLGITAGLAATSAIAKTNLPFVGSIPGGTAIGRVAGGAAVGYGGAQAGIFAARATGLASGSQKDVQGQLMQTLKQAVVVVFSALSELAVKAREAGLKFGNAINVVKAELQLGGALLGNALAALVDILADATAGVARTIGQFLVQMDSLDLGTLDAGFLGSRDLGTLNLGTAGVGQTLIDFADGLDHAEDGLRTSTETMDGYVAVMQAGINLTAAQTAELEKMREGTGDMTLALADALGLIEESPSIIDRLKIALAGALAVAQSMAENQEKQSNITFSKDAVDAWIKFQEDLGEIASQENENLLEEQRDYEEQRAEIIRDYGQKVADMMEDEQIRYARALENTRTREAAIRAESLETLEGEEADHQEKMAEIIESARETDATATKDHLKRLEDITRDGKEKVLQAAARLDAWAIREAQRATKIQLDEEKDRYKEEREKRQEALEDALTQEAESHDERIKLQKEKADEQIRNLWEQFQEEERLREEDQQRRYARMQRDHEAQLQELAVQHTRRLNQIITQAAQERAMLEKEFTETYNKLQQEAGAHQAMMINIQKTGQTAAEQELKNWWARQTGLFGAAPSIGSTISNVGGIVSNAFSGLGSFLGGFASGGTLGGTGFYLGHAGEEVLSAPYANQLRRLMGGSISPAALVGAVSGSQKQVTVNMPISFPDTSDPQTMVDLVMRVVRGQLVPLLENM